ncbi:MAG: AAA family ATPase, partial [Verrucomicrobiales bacterium]
MISTMIERKGYLEEIRTGLGRGPVVALTGPRQCGKTTLARQLMGSDEAGYFDLEDPATSMVLDSPMSALAPLTGLVVVDEAQRAPGLFPVLRGLADREGQPATF